MFGAHRIIDATRRGIRAGLNHPATREALNSDPVLPAEPALLFLSQSQSQLQLAFLFGRCAGT
jgi:hypothetical protein